jgi:NAD(P)H-dependent flavin oxidoreductase YrpB (nitropropane dioxygenase family)
MKRNRICELLGIRYPIIQAPMNWLSGADLVAAVSSAGGLGTLGPNVGAKTITRDAAVTAERLRSQIRKVRSLTTAPFAVNIVIGETEEERQYSQKCVEVVLEEGIGVVIVSVGSPDAYTRVLKDNGVRVLQAISTQRHAEKAEAAGVDGVICLGFEAGGHKGLTELTTMVLVPMVVDAVRIPVVAGGGIGDARGALAALALGADGVYMGTRFMVTHEADAHPRVKEAVVKSEDACTVSVPKEIMLARDLRNRFTQKYLEMRAAGASSEELRDFVNEHSLYYSLVLGDYEDSEVNCGQIAGLIRSVASAAEVIEGIAGGVSSALEGLQNKLSAFL